MTFRWASGSKKGSHKMTSSKALTQEEIEELSEPKPTFSLPISLIMKISLYSALVPCHKENVTQEQEKKDGV